MSMAQDPQQSSGAVTQAGASDKSNRRAVPRFPLIADAYLSDLGSGSEFRARVSEISLHGAYVDFLNPFPDGTNIRLRVSRDNGTFETDARIVYNHPGLGLGIFFLNVPPEQRKILETWLEELANQD
jgi:PilZ domain-containing protein